ncbi:type III pantothenate kinase [Prosthecochloris sp. SCSIO W1101]|uniref:type III pantothenate kinase n=1 Tax=Prosthecochloris sp. SCSIO W1101 TaxID=2992242 RepID=UPI00223CE4D7|nr:type III pantothenate kinase [Prosthecochloris sp. SCSIO W1101]UZJ40477.1 type III pantothenate kinase [Prosthecochloris sp. SCSIO W1101]
MVSLSMMVVLIIEIGNSVTDCVVFEGERCIATYTIQTEKLKSGKEVLELTRRILNNHPSIYHAAVCSVVPSVGELFLSILASTLSGKVVEINSSLSLPFTLDYDPPHTLGADRLALCALSCRSWPDKAIIALDIGTAITFDVVSSRGVYLGGMILPGLDLMTAVLHDRTAKLPLVEITEEPIPLLGKSTADCMQSGVFWGCVKQVEGLLARVHRFLSDELQENAVRIIGTGGNSRLVASVMENPPVIDEHAVLKGAKVLLDMNL